MLQVQEEIIKIQPKGLLTIPKKFRKKLESNLNPNGHLRTYTLSILKTEMKLSGFSIINSTYLYAFKSLYGLKTLIAKNFLPFFEPNLIILVARKI